MDNARVERFLKDITHWAAGRADILAVALVGSYARGAATPTSDVDLVILAEHPEIFLHDKEWVKQFGGVQKEQVEYYGKVTSLRVWYGDQLEVEYGLTDASWADSPLDEGTRQVISDGMKAVFERIPLLSRHLPLF